MNAEETKLGVEIQSVPESENVASELDTQARGKIPTEGLTEAKLKDAVTDFEATVYENCPKILPAEDIELIALRNHIFSKSFTPAGVAFHIVALCYQPLVTTSTTTWDFKDRASIPDMVHNLLRQPGYLEGIYPSLKVVMSDNIGNEIWSAGIATTFAYFDVIRTLPTLKEMENEKE